MYLILFMGDIHRNKKGTTLVFDKVLENIDF